MQIAQNDTQLERLTYDIRPVGTVLGTTPSYEATRATSSVESQLAYINVNNDDIHVIVYGRRIDLQRLRNPI